MYGTVLVALDGSALAERAIAYAERFAARDGRIVLVRVVEPARLVPSSGSADFAAMRDPQRLTERLREALDRPRAEAAAYLENARQMVVRTDVLVVTRVLEGGPVERLVEAAGDAELLVVAARGRTGLPRLLLGSVAERVVQRAPVPVLVVRERQGGPEKLILAPTDLSPGSRGPLAHAARLAARLGARLRLLHVLTDLAGYGAAHVTRRGRVDLLGAARDVPARVDGYMAELARYAASAGGATAGPVETLVLELRGSVAATIARAAGTAQADLVVMGSEGRTGLDRWLVGSVAEETVRTADCPVLVVK